MFKVIYDGSAEAKAHKDIYAAAIENLAKEDPKVIYLDADLMNSSGTYKFWRNNPAQAINCGISEANMMGVAAGLSAVGRIPYVHTFGPFASRRCFDQVFLAIGYAKNNVRIFGSDPGVAAAFNGGTHMPFEDMALMRAIPGSAVFDLADGVQFDWLLKAVKERDGVTYFRSTRKTYKKIYEAGSTFEIGKGNVLREGKNITIIACGLMVGEAMGAADILAAEGIEATVVDMFTVKPIDKALIAQCAQATGAIVTAENHNIIGGLGEATAAALLEANLSEKVKFKRHGVQDSFGEVGPVDYLQKQFKLTASDLAETCRQTLK